MSSCAITAAFIVVSDRIFTSQRPNKASALLHTLVNSPAASYPMDVVMDEVIPEGYTSVVNALTRAIESGAHVIITVGGTGIRTKNQTPEASAEFIQTRFEGLEQQIVVRGSQNSPLAGLSRGLVGVTSRDEQAALIINAPSSQGGIKDTWSVMGPVIPNIFEGLRATED
ncbi:molybdopterin-binding protein [Corynebacterium diphtheriae]